ncbi:uncharacterized protein LOC132931653 [Rhopalosiphum padi]|uniref:uncharacterized protein LOC132931653 n=1 Tax=Rhopalosiphum padi TaxID=40932 RepID=UPI00298D64B9|nr:uncharacterized protein LOC132931653 [Rhopalosiphum padi]
MFSSMFKSLVNVSNKQNSIEHKRQNIDVLKLLNEIEDDNSTENIVVSKVLPLEISTKDLSISSDLVNSKNDFKSIEQKKQVPVEQIKETQLLSQIKSLHCLFTWNLKPQKKQDIITHIKNKYGNYNLDISVTEFTFVRFIGNLIISYELYQNGKPSESDTKILEIGNWLEKLDKGTDEFYLSINVALKHIQMANFVHMLFATNGTGGFKWLFKDIVSFDNMNNKSKAALYAIRAAILIEYGKSLECFKNASKYAKEACELDPKTSHWFHIYSLVLTAQRQFVHTHDLYSTERLLLQKNALCPTENEINLAIQQAISSCDGKNTYSVNLLVLISLNELLANEFPVAQKGLPIYQANDSEYISEINTESSLKKDMKIIVKRHKNGEDAIPFLIGLLPKYNKNGKWEIMAQICSYTILFTNKFRAGVEHFLFLIGEPTVSTSDLVINHNSSFIGSKIFNLAELIWNEIKLASKNTNTTFLMDNLYYYTIFLKINETCNLKMRIVDPFMRFKIISDSSAIPNCAKIMYNNDFEMEQYSKSRNTFTNFPQTINSIQDTNIYFNQHFNSFQQYQCTKSIPSLTDLKFNLIFQSTFYTNNTKTNIASNLTNIDTSLTKLPRGKTSQATYKACLNNLLQNYPNSFRIYTDASKIHNNVGIAVVSNKDTYTYKLSSDYTSCEAEAVAILRALDYALAENFNNYIILSDSLSTISCIQNINTASDVVNSILCLIHAHQLKGNLMHLIWIPSHNAIEGNDIADRLARQIAMSSTAITYSHNSFMATNIKSKFLKS